MKRADHRNAVVIVELAAQARNALLAFQQIFCRHPPPATNDFWPDDFDRLLQILPAIAALIRLGVPVARRSAAEDIADEHFLTVKTASNDDSVEQLTGDAHKGDSLAVLVAPRRLADEHDVLIRTPIAGVVTARDAQPGTVVLPGTPLVSVGNPDQLQLLMHLSADAVAGVQVGATVRFALTEQPTTTMTATVTRVAPTVDTLTRTVAVIATPTGTVRSGRAESFVQAEIAGRGGAPALVVPSSAVQAREGDTVVIVAEQRGEGLFIEAVPVRTGRRAGDRTEILAGVSPGRRVIVGRAAIAKAELIKRRSPDGE